MKDKYDHSEPSPAIMRSLPYVENYYNRYEFEVIKPLHGFRSLARPWFNQPGGGFQFTPSALPNQLKLPTAKDLKNAGFIIKINF